MPSQAEIMVLNTGLRTCVEILRDPQNPLIHPHSYLTQAAFALLIIHLKDILMILDRLGHRIDFTDDLPVGVDVTRQVSDMRNAVCHLGSHSRHMDERANLLHFGHAVGRTNLIQTGDILLANPYDDDIAFFFGSLRLLLKRHIFRAIDQARGICPRIAAEAGHHWFSI